MSGGIYFVQIPADLELDPRFQLLAQSAGTANYFTAIGVWLAIVLKAARDCHRDTSEAAQRLYPRESVKALVDVGLLDADGGLVESDFESLVQRVLDQRSEKRASAGAGGRRGGTTRGREGARDGMGRFVRSVRTVSEPAPELGVAGATPPSGGARQELEKDQEARAGRETTDPGDERNPLPRYRSAGRSGRPGGSSHTPDKRGEMGHLHRRAPSGSPA